MERMEAQEEEAAAGGRPVVMYIHCRGGHARVGLVCSLLLGEIYGLPGKRAMSLYQVLQTYALHHFITLHHTSSNSIRIRTNTFRHTSSPFIQFNPYLDQCTSSHFITLHPIQSVSGPMHCSNQSTAQVQLIHIWTTDCTSSTLRLLLPCSVTMAGADDCGHAPPPTSIFGDHGRCR